MKNTPSEKVVTISIEEFRKRGRKGGRVIAKRLGSRGMRALVKNYWNSPAGIKRRTCKTKTTKSSKH